jgi:hypothetical protein
MGLIVVLIPLLERLTPFPLLMAWTRYLDLKTGWSASQECP